MKVLRGVISSIGLLAVVGGGVEPAAAAEAATCTEEYYLCLNEATQTDGRWERLAAELGCASDLYVCGRKRAFGA